MIKLSRTLSMAQLYGSGLAFILILLILFVFSKINLLLYGAIAVTILLMISPAPFKYFAYIWLAFGELLGLVIGRLILSVIYSVLVVPIGLLKRKSLRSNMHLSLFKKDTNSVFKERNHTFSENDFYKPF